MASVAGIGRGGGGGGDLIRCCCGSGACRWPWGWNCGAARGVVDPERGGRGEGEGRLPSPVRHLSEKKRDPLWEGGCVKEKERGDGEERGEGRLASLGLGPPSVMVTDPGRPQ